MAQTILEMRHLPDFSERCVTLPDGTERSDPRFERLLPLVDWWTSASEHPPKRKTLDPFSFGGGLVSYLVMLDVIAEGQDFRWRIFGGRHVQEFGADLKNVSIRDLIQDHPAAIQLMNVMETVLEQREIVPFEIRYFSQNRVLREAVGFFMPLVDDDGAVAYLFGAADWTILK